MYKFAEISQHVVDKMKIMYAACCFPVVTTGRFSVLTTNRPFQPACKLTHFRSRDC